MHAFRSRSFTTVLTLLAVSSSCLVGCGGPTKQGIVARQEANSRFAKTTSVVSYDQARQAFESGDLSSAQKHIREAIARSDQEPRYWALLGRIELESRRLEEARVALDKAVTLDPNYAEGYYFRGVVMERWSQDEKALADYQKAAELDGAKLSYVLATAETMVAMQHIEESREFLLSKLAYFEHNAALNELLGDLSSMENDDKAAWRYFEVASLIDPEAPMICEKLLRALYAAQEWQKCLDQARRLTRAEKDKLNGVAPESFGMYEGRSLAMLGRFTEARNAFANVVHQNPEHLEGWIDLGQAAWNAGDDVRAEAASQRVIALAESRFEGYWLRGLVAEKRGETAAAVQWFQRAVSCAPENATPLVSLAIALRRNGQDAESAVMLAKAMKADPSFAPAKRAFTAIDPTGEATE
ncbi:MAG: tetratricopeptide repeat protein [Phycisphaerales bacterium]|nr:tetratricopeptide repeat protein [Phycisphaerales bacterium]